MTHKRIASAWAKTRDQIEHSGRQVRFRNALGHEQCRKRRLLRRLEYYGVAGRNPGTEILRGDHRWKIPRRDDAPRADSYLKSEEALIGIARGNDGGLESLHVFCRDSEILRRLLYFGKRFGEIRFTLFEGDNRRNRFFVHQDAIRNPMASCGALKRRRESPIITRFAGRFDRTIDIFFRSMRNCRHQFPSRWTVDFETLGSFTVDPLAVNEKLLWW